MSLHGKNGRLIRHQVQYFENQANVEIERPDLI